LVPFDLSVVSGPLSVAVDAGAEAAGRVGTVISVHVIARPHDDLPGMLPKAKKAAAGAVGGRMAETAKK
jgi:microcompartment protein CcmL/EutN